MVHVVCSIFFFFSSRRRHTRSLCDWSSDVCSSDLPETLNAVDAWLSSIPGNAYANVRQPIVSTLNLAHMMPVSAVWRSEEHTSELQSHSDIVCRLLLEKKKMTKLRNPW